MIFFVINYRLIKKKNHTFNCELRYFAILLNRALLRRRCYCLENGRTILSPSRTTTNIITADVSSRSLLVFLFHIFIYQLLESKESLTRLPDLNILFFLMKSKTNCDQAGAAIPSLDFALRGDPGSIILRCFALCYLRDPYIS